MNLLIAIVLNAMEEARELERRHLLREEHGADEPPALDPEARAHVLQRIAVLRAALEDLEVELAVGEEEPEPAG